MLRCGSKKEVGMLEPDDPWLYELCFPGAITGETEVSCPHCGACLTVAVEDPMGVLSVCCSQCGREFTVDLGA